jgi:hypothetical protein
MADEVSFDEFYLATRGAVLGQLTVMTLDRELAADTVQEDRGLAAGGQPIPASGRGPPGPAPA